MATDTATKTETVTFISVYPEQRLVRRQVRDIRNAEGAWEQFDQDAEIRRLEQRNHELQVTGASDDKLHEIDRSPWDVVFGQDHRFTTDDPKLVEWMRNHRGYNSVGGDCAFFEEGKAPEEPKPRLAVQMNAIAAAESADDLDAVEHEERQTLDRKIVLDAIGIARERLENEPSDPDDEAASEAAADGETPSIPTPSSAE